MDPRVTPPPLGQDMAMVSTAKPHCVRGGIRNLSLPRFTLANFHRDSAGNNRASTETPSAILRADSVAFSFPPPLAGEGGHDLLTPPGAIFHSADTLIK